LSDSGRSCELTQAEIVTTPHQDGRAVGVDLVTAFRADQRPLGGVPGGRWSGKRVRLSV
jgi:hypothetical protein